MKNFSKLFLLLAALCSSAGAVRAEDEAPQAAPVPIKHGTNGESILTLDEATQKRIGLEITNLVSSEWQPEIRATGRALDTSPLADLMMDYSRALITFDSSHQELERAKQLKKDDNISQRAFQDTEAAYRQNFAAVMAIRLKIESAWGKRIAALPGEIVVPPGTPRKPDPAMGRLMDLVTTPGCLVRIDLPTGERLLNPSSARIVPLAKRERPITASFFDTLPVMDAQTQQLGFLFLNDQPNTTDRLMPGEAVAAFVKSDMVPVTGSVIPASAVLRHDGKGWFYLQTGPTDFTRRELPLDRAVDGGVFAGELSATNRVVVTGAQTMLSAELSGGNFNSGQRD